MPLGRNAHVVLIAISAAVASALLWLGATFRPDGLLGALQDALQPLYVLPFVFGAALGGNVHAPSEGLVFLGLLIEAYVAGLAVCWVVERTLTASQRGQGRGSE